jgi:para-aminobenzoate synthetase component 2
VTARRVLVVDNRDSFVHTLAGYLQELGAGVMLTDAGSIDPAQAAAAIAGYDGVVVSPGPGAPEHAGASPAVVAAAADAGIPLLGVCLGHQVIAHVFGGHVGEAPELMHGMTSAVHHDGSALYRGLPDPFTAGRYHSLAVEEGSLPAALEVTSRTDSGTVMGLAHRSLPISGVQFHPESVLTDGGYRLLGNWLTTVGVVDAATLGAGLQPHRAMAAGYSPEQ